MKWRDLLTIVGDSAVFTTASLLAGQRTPGGVRQQLVRWTRAGKVVMLRRGVYAVAEPYARVSPHPFVVANALRKASYVSLQSALAYHGLIPEHTPVTTSVTTKRPEELTTPLGRYAFRHVRTSLFFGFSERETAAGQRAFVASAGKALVDLLYLTPGSDSPAYIAELRLAQSSELDVSELRRLGARCGSRKVLRALRLIEATWREEAGCTAL